MKSRGQRRSLKKHSTEWVQAATRVITGDSPHVRKKGEWHLRSCHCLARIKELICSGIKRGGKRQHEPWDPSTSFPGPLVLSSLSHHLTPPPSSCPSPNPVLWLWPNSCLSSPWPSTKKLPKIMANFIQKLKLLRKGDFFFWFTKFDIYGMSQWPMLEKTELHETGKHQKGWTTESPHTSSKGVHPVFLLPLLPPTQHLSSPSSRRSEIKSKSFQYIRTF